MSSGMSLEMARRINGSIRSIALNHKTLAGQHLETCGIHAGQEWVFQALQERSPLTNTELAGWSGCEPPTVTNTVSKLEAAGLLTRTRRPGDARVIDVATTPAGHELSSRIDEAWIALAEDAVGHLAPEETAELVDALEALATRLRAIRERRATQRR